MLIPTLIVGAALCLLLKPQQFLAFAILLALVAYNPAIFWWLLIAALGIVSFIIYRKYFK